MTGRRCELAILATVTALLLLATGNGFAQDLSREIVDAAKREGKVAIYGSIESETMVELSKVFEAKHKVKVEYWRASSTKVMDRALVEARTGRPLFDLVLTNETPMRILKKEGAFGKFTAPAGASYPESVKDPDGVLTPPYRLAVVGLLYNPRMVKAEETPKSWKRSEERRVGKECRSRWSPYH